MLRALKCIETGQSFGAGLRQVDRAFLSAAIREASITGDSMAYYLIRHEKDLAEAYVRRLGLIKAPTLPNTRGGVRVRG